jgi:hypothetical protein
MIVVESGGHGAYVAEGNPCGDAAVTAFLAEGKRPERPVVTCADA